MLRNNKIFVFLRFNTIFIEINMNEFDKLTLTLKQSLEAYLHKKLDIEKCKKKLQRTSNIYS